MRVLLILATTLSCTIVHATPSIFTPVVTTKVESSRITLLRSIDLEDRRTNGDRNPFYRTAYKIVLDDGRHVTEKILETDLYTPEDLKYNGEGMRPSFIIDPVSKVITVFATGKGPNNNDYSMVGYAYRLDSSKKWKKETVFDSGNYGWFSYFGGSANGNPELWHFSFAGYRQLRSFRTDTGEWQTSDLGSISPDGAVAEMQNKKNILVSTSWSDQRPKGVISNSSQKSNSREGDAGTVVGAVIAGAIILGTVKWLLEPFRDNSSTSSSTQSSNNQVNFSKLRLVSKGGNEYQLYCEDTFVTTMHKDSAGRMWKATFVNWRDTFEEAASLAAKDVYSCHYH